jgi:cytochrome c-type biogenesis protein CcmH
MVVIFISDNFLTLRAAQPGPRSGPNPNSPVLLFASIAKRRWRLLSLAILVALAAASVAGHLRSSAPTRADRATAGFASTDLTATYDKLRSFAAGVDGATVAPPMSSKPAATERLADVETMIGRLAARLEKEPSDVTGWRMLGWSYFQTGRFADAVAAYDKAIALDPDNAELVAARDEAKRTADGQGPTAVEMAAAQSLSGEDRASMVAGMVDGLAERLAKSPRDEAGWIKLMRSRMVLGQSEAAAKDLETAKRAFGTETDVVNRLMDAARALGVPGA